MTILIIYKKIPCALPVYSHSSTNISNDTVQPGDTLTLQIYENVDDGLLTQGGGTAAVLDQIQVDGNGFIFVPYAGRIKASGNTPEAIRRLITEKLQAQTPDPQVIVQRLAGDGATVSLIGGIGAQGVYPIERPTRTLTAMLAKAGGITLPPEIAQVTLIRGNHSGKVWIQDLYRNPRLDIALATVGGLNPGRADPTGIFVFRNEPAHIANKVLGRSDVGDNQRFIYVLNLTSPNGVFLARDFDIRDGDTVYVTEAPYNQFTKILSAIVGPASTAASLDSLAN